MTTAIEVTKKTMFGLLSSITASAKASPFAAHMDKSLKILDSAIEAHLEALRQDRANLVTERDTLRNRVQVLEMANATSGDVIRSLKREAEQARKATCSASDSNPERREKSVFEMQEELDASRAHTEAERRKYRNIELALQIQTMSAVLGVNRILSSGWYSEPPKETCMHSFHPAFPSGELCTFCGVGK